MQRLRGECPASPATDARPPPPPAARARGCTQDPPVKSGIRPEVARGLADAGVDLAGQIVLATLQDGLQRSMRGRGQR